MNKIYKRLVENRHFNNFRAFIIGGIFSILIGYFGNYLINRNLSKEDLGLFSYYQNWMTLFASVFPLSIYQAYLRFNNDSYDTRTLKKIVYRFSIFSTILLLLVSLLIFRNIFISSFACLILFNERVYFFRSSKQIRSMNLLKYLSSIILILCIFIVVKIGNLTYNMAILSYGVGYFIAFIFGNIYKNDSKYKESKEGKKLRFSAVIKYTFPIAIGSIVTWISTVSDQIVIKNYLTLVDVGNYAIGYRIITVIKIFTSLFLLYYPMLYFEEADKKQYSSILKIRLFFIACLFIVTSALIMAKDTVYIIMGAKQYLDYSYIFSLMAIAEFLRIVATLFLTFRSYTLQTWHNTTLVATTAVLSLVLNLILIPKYGIIAAASIQVLTAAIFFVLTIFVAIRPEYIYFKNEK